MTTSFRRQRTALIDCDMVAYRAAGMVSSTSGDANDLQELLPNVISTWAREASCTDIILCKGADSFRKQVYPEYKANRVGKPKPPLLDEARALIEDLEYPAKRINGLEADDIQGILSTRNPDTHVIINNDKDMLTLPGVLVYNPDKMDFPEFITKEVAEYNLWEQILTGDSTDNYKGIPKCGPVKARKILDPALVQEWGYFDIVMKAYIAAGLSDEYLLQMCQCAKILDNTLWNPDTKTYTLWNPYESN